MTASTTMDGNVGRHVMIDEVGRQTMDVGRSVILHIHAVMRVGRFHTMDNDATQKSLDRAYNSLEELFEVQDEVEILFYAKDFYINSFRIKSNEAIFELLSELAQLLQERGIGSLHFPNLPTRAALAAFLEVFLRLKPGVEDDIYAAINQSLVDRQIQDIRLTPFTPDTLDSLTAIDKATFIKQAYFRTIQVTRDVYLLARRGRPIRLKQVKRVIQNLVDIFDDPNRFLTDLLLLLTGLKNWQGYLFNHATNVAVLSIGLGNSIDLDREELRDLGIAAILADLGNAGLSSALLDDGGDLTDEQTTAIHTHPARGVALISNMEEMDPALIQSTIISLTHHVGYDGKGYPERLNLKQNLFAQIIGICDAYDAMTSPRPWRGQPLSPPMALEILARESGSRWNPLLTKAFIHWIGETPRGTIVSLGSGEVGMVIGREARLGEDDQLRIRVIMEANKKPAGDRVVTVGGGTDGQISGTPDVPAMNLGKIQAKAVLMDKGGE
jgi:HD-GYP domain-containing protein (c-di-GMP phosphodiesterase class II)